MPRFNVEYNGKWACFSTIVDGFVTQFMDKDTYEKWRIVEYNYGDYGHGPRDYQPAEECNMMSMKDALHKMSRDMTPLDFCYKLKEDLGLTKKEAEEYLVLAQIECCKTCIYYSEKYFECTCPEQSQGEIDKMSDNYCNFFEVDL